MGDGAVIEVAPGARPARPVHLVFAYASERAAAVFTRSLVTIGAGAARDAVREPRGHRRGRLPGQHRARSRRSATARRSITSRSAPRAAMRCTSRRCARPSAPTRGLTDMSFVTGGTVVRNQPFVRCAGPRAEISHQRREPSQGAPARRYHHAGRSRRRPLPQPRGLQVGARRCEPRRVPGQDHRPPRRPEDRRPHDDARAAPLRRRRGRQQAGARDLRRRRAVRPRRDLRRARRQRSSST